VNPKVFPDAEQARIGQDFQRDVCCLFGLPVDNLTLDKTKHLLREKAKLPYNTVLSTINVNWAVQSFSDPAFRAAIINSDVVTLDGMPLLWLAKLLGYPMTEVVAGSTLIQELNQEKGREKPLSIFFFGGEEEAGRQAVEKVNANKGGLEAVGRLNPGFGSIEAMSSDAIINAINAPSPDILLVALGAKKGTRWIEHNRRRLNAKIISHLGATINFLAGTVQRAPALASKCGLEWVWRIIQEPKLFARYAGDGLALLRVLLGRLPLWLRYRAWQKHFRLEPADNTGQWQENEQTITLSLGRNLLLTKDSPLRDLFSRAALSGKDLIINFQATEFVDGAYLGLIMILAKHQQRNGKKLIFLNVQDRLTLIFYLFCIPNTSPGEAK